MNNPYQVLGVDPSDSLDNIKKAYRKLAKKHHPDSGGDELQFKKISAAYNQILESHSQPQAQKQHRYTTADVNDLDEFFADFFRQAGTGFHHSHYQQGNRDLTTTVTLSLEDIVYDQKRTVNVNTGRSQKTVEVNIPAGVNDGATIRYTGYGSDVLTRKPPGDLIVTVRINNPTNKFQRSSQCDIFASVAVDAVDAILGTQLEFVGIANNRMKITVPPGTQNHGQLRIKGQGLPKINSNEYGDLYLFVEIVVPKHITESQRELLEKYRRESS